VTHLRSHIDWFTADAPDAWQEIARLDHPGISLERVALVPLPLFADPAAAEAIADGRQQRGGCLLGGFIHSSNWDPPPWKTCCAARPLAAGSGFAYR
jgi:cytosine deaminase